MATIIYNIGAPFVTIGRPSIHLVVTIFNCNSSSRSLGLLLGLSGSLALLVVVSDCSSVAFEHRVSSANRRMRSCWRGPGMQVSRCLYYSWVILLSDASCSGILPGRTLDIRSFRSLGLFPCAAALELVLLFRTPCSIHSHPDSCHHGPAGRPRLASQVGVRASYLCSRGSSSLWIVSTVSLP